MDDAARKAIFNEFPDAEPFADLFIDEDPEAFREMARIVDGRARAVAQNRAAPLAEPSVEQAIKDRDWGAYLKAKRREASQE